jgi:type I restriction-modification system DNA methylase subunit
MEREDGNKVLELIEEIKKKNSEMENVVSNLNILSRHEILKEIIKNIIEKNQIFQEPEFHKEKDYKQEFGDDSTLSIPNIIDNLLSNIQKYPSKRVIYLRIFLERFHDISEQDKNVILQSIKDEKIEDLKEKILSLVNTFELEI